MGDEKITIWQELTQGLGKATLWIGYISLGVMAKLAFDSRNNTLTKKQIIVKSVLSIFCGYLAAVICENMGYTNWAKVIVPVSTLLGEALVLYVMNNWRSFVNKLLPAWFQQIKNDKKL
jgi:hypothetical protein